MSDNFDPYQPPQSSGEKAPEPLLVEEPITVSAGRGYVWVVTALKLISNALPIWLVMGLLMIVITFGVVVIPFVGNVVSSLISPILAAGFYFAYQYVDKGNAPSINWLFAGLIRMPAPLLAVGGITWLVSLVSAVVASHMVFGNIDFALALNGIGADNGSDIEAMLPQMPRFMMWYLAMYMPMIWALLFAPVLIALHRLSVVVALKLSFAGCVKNIGAFMVCMLSWFCLLMLVALISLIPLVGWIALVLVVLAMPAVGSATLYFAYKDIFLTKKASITSVVDKP